MWVGQESGRFWALSPMLGRQNIRRYLQEGGCLIHEILCNVLRALEQRDPREKVPEPRNTPESASQFRLRPSDLSKVRLQMSTDETRCFDARWMLDL